MFKILFKEEQKYRPMRVRVVLPLVLTAVLVMMIFGMSRQPAYNSQSGIAPGINLELILVVAFAVVIMASVFFIVFQMKLITWVDEEGIHMRYPPLRNRKFTIAKDSIRHYEVRKYRARLEYGGWGYRRRGKLFRHRNYGIAFTASGNTGVQFELLNGDKILVGTQRDQAFLYAIDKIMKRENT